MLRDQGIQQGDSFMIIYSTSSRETFGDVENLYFQITKFKTSTYEHHVMLVGSKSDHLKEREISRQEGHDLARKLNCGFMEVSAKSRENVQAAFERIVRSRTFTSHGTGEIARKANRDVAVREKQRGGLGFVQWLLSFIPKRMSLHQ